MNVESPQQPRAIQCAFCDSTDVAFFSLFGQTLLGSQYYCNNCRTIFEVVRFEDDDAAQSKKQGSSSSSHQDEDA